MTPKERSAALQAFSKALQDRPLDPAVVADQALYVRELHVQRHGTLTMDPVARLALQIQRAEGSRVWLFTGSIGSGKSTELRRLRQELTEAKCIVFLADAADYVNLNQKIEISDFLISVTAAFAEQAGVLLGQDQIASGYWERIWNFLRNTEIEVKEIAVKAGVEGAVPGGKLTAGGDLKAALRQDPDVKQLLQNRLRGHLSSLARDLEEYRGDVLAEIRGKVGPDAKVVLLIDSLERLRGTGDADDAVFSSVKAMFTQYADMLRLAGVQVVYSVAPYLIKLAPQLNGLFGAGTLCNLTTAHVFRERSRDLDTAGGVAVIRKIVERRFLGWQQLISPDVLDRLIEASGGDLRDLFRLLSILLLELEFSPDTNAVLEFALEQVRRDMTWITEPQRERLSRIAATKAPRLETEADRDALVHDLETKRVLMYRNGEEWYDVHPLLRTLVDAAPAGVPGGAA